MPLLLLNQVLREGSSTRQVSFAHAETDFETAGDSVDWEVGFVLEGERTKGMYMASYNRARNGAYAPGALRCITWGSFTDSASRLQ